MIKHLIITGALGVAAIGLAPVATAITCEELNSQILAHNNAYVDETSQAAVDAYNREADRLNSMPCY